jgi:hypothetical protein
MRLTSFVVALLVLVPCVVQAQGRGVDRAPAVGTKAPDFDLHRLKADGTKSAETVKLSAVCAKKPVALVFGSYT